MANHLQIILGHWLELSKQGDCSQQWVLATVIHVQGSSYRKPGAMMIVGSSGQRLGLISGGCLERDIAQQANRVMHTQTPLRIVYDSTNNSDVAWQLGLGCGGVVTVLLQPLTTDNNFLQLPDLYGRLSQGQSATYSVDLSGGDKNYLMAAGEVNASEQILAVNLKPQRKLVIFGAGIDAIPLVAMADNLGWQTVLVDHRLGYAEPENFIGAQDIIREQALDLVDDPRLTHADAVIIMTHNVSLDACALKLIQQDSQFDNLAYIGLLGPEHRKEKVLACAELSESDFNSTLYGPMGFDIGGELPESIALSVLAQCHQCVEMGRRLYHFQAAETEHLNGDESSAAHALEAERFIK